MASWYILIIILTSVQGWDFQKKTDNSQKAFRLSDGTVILRNTKREMGWSVLNGHTKPQSSDESYQTNQPGIKATKPSYK
jgi:hypothetical protein